MPLKLIRLELARDPEFPEGSRRHGYELVAPLDETDHLAPAEWQYVSGSMPGATVVCSPEPKPG